MDDMMDRSMARVSFTLLLLGVAAKVALLLAAVGVYGLISYVVGHETKEIGIRLAVGAEPADVVRLFLRRGLMLAAVGVVIGFAAAFALTRAMAGLLFGVKPHDPLTFSAVGLCLTAITLFASYVPARKAACADPVEALRSE
jgi:ABC-type antimicrobial peptide transport system permease subunit